MLWHQKEIERFQDIVDIHHRSRPVLDELVHTHASTRKDASRDRKDFTSVFQSEASCDQCPTWLWSFPECSLAKAQWVLSVPTTLPAFLARGARLALVSVHADFRADALRLWGRQSFGAASAPHSRVLSLARVLPAGAPPHLPRERHTGHTRGWGLLDRDRPPEMPSTGRAGWGQCHTDTDEIAARAVSCDRLHIHDTTATVSCSAWTLRSGCRPCLQRCVSTSQ